MTPHPAEWAPGALAEVPMLLARWGVPAGGRVVDPYAGHGHVHKLAEAGYETIAVERERAWVDDALKLYPARPTVCGDAARLAWIVHYRADAIVTSPSWGNRLADRYLGGSDEKAGRAPSARSRRTYATALGYVPDDASTCVHPFNPDYRELHRIHVEEWTSILRPGGVVIVDIADHSRGGRRIMVTDWWVSVLEMRIGRVEERRCVEASRWTYGANSTRYPETLLVAVKEGP